MLFPALALAGDVLFGRVRVDARWLPVMAAGYLLYRRSGEYRDRKGAGSRGFAEPPKRLVTDGPYAYTRNPMYLGHLVFLAGLVGATRSPIALACALWQQRRLSERVRIDEERLERIFGDAYRDYVARVPRWLPRWLPRPPTQRRY